jgi:hypothetical protein
MLTRMLLALITSGALALTGATIANAAPTDGATVTRDETLTLPFTNPCTGATSQITITFKVVANGVNAGGPPLFHFTQSLVGDFALSDGTTGHFTLHTDIEANPNGSVAHSTTEAYGTTADGSQFSLHFVSQSNDAPPDTSITFDHCA